MAMTNSQFQGIIRLSIEQMEAALKITPGNEKLQKLLDIFKDMVEDGND